MRIDKYIWCVRLFKTRSIAAKAVDGNKVLLNGEQVKSSKELKPGDEVSVKELAFWRTYKVLDLPKSRVGAKLVPDLLTETTDAETLSQIQEVRSVNRERDMYFKGKGRPTKRDRRNLDDFLE